MTRKIILCTGGFDPLHSGHIKYLKAAKNLGDILIVGVNSDAWLQRKKVHEFMPIEERSFILNALECVDYVIDDFDDSDGSALDAIHKVKTRWPGYHVIFANGGDRTATNIPEMIVKDIEFVFGVGGENKSNSSSWILNQWQKTPVTNRTWGYYRILHDVEGTKVKELTILPNQSISLQRHTHRSEYWHIIEGRCLVLGDPNIIHWDHRLELRKHDNVHIPANEWHCLINPFAEPCKVLEIQYGTECIESDIERSVDYYFDDDTSIIP